jgi:hypothetical protein
LPICFPVYARLLPIRAASAGAPRDPLAHVRARRTTAQSLDTLNDPSTPRATAPTSAGRPTI